MTRVRKHTQRARRVSSVSIAGLAVATSLFTYSLFVISPGGLMHIASTSFATAVMSVTAGVPANHDNTLAQQLQEKEARLNQMEQGTAAKTGDVPLDTGMYSLMASVLLFVLVGVNFYFDHIRGRGGVIAVNMPINLRQRR